MTYNLKHILILRKPYFLLPPVRVYGSQFELWAQLVKKDNDGGD